MRSLRWAVIGLALAASACSSDKPGSAESATDAGSGVSGTVGAQGGTVALPFGMTVIVPAGATTSTAIIEVVDAGPVPDGAIKSPERALGPRYEIRVHDESGRESSLTAPDPDHPFLFTLPVTGQSASDWVYAYLGLGEQAPLPLVLDASQGSSQAAWRLLMMPARFQVVAVAGPDSATPSQVAEGTPPEPPITVQDTAHPPQSWGTTSWDIVRPWNPFAWGDQEARARKWMPIAASALAGVGLRAPFLTRTKSGHYPAVLYDGDATKFSYSPLDGGAETPDFSADDLAANITGVIYLLGSNPNNKMMADEDETDVYGFPPHFAAHELLHAVVRSYQIGTSDRAVWSENAELGGATWAQPNDCANAGIKCFPGRGFHEGLAASVGHLIAQQTGTRQYPLRIEGLFFRLDWPLGVGNGLTEVRNTDAVWQSKQYGVMDFYTWLVRRYNGGSLDFLPYLLELWAKEGSANYSVMNNLQNWLPKAPGTLAEAYVEFVTQRAFLRDDQVSGGVMASQLRGDSPWLTPDRYDGTQHQVVSGLWTTAPMWTDLALSKTLQHLVSLKPFAADNDGLNGIPDGDVKLSISVQSGGAPASDVRVRVVQLQGNAVLVKDVTGEVTWTGIGLDPKQPSFILMMNVNTTGLVARLDVEATIVPSSGCDGGCVEGGTDAAVDGGGGSGGSDSGSDTGAGGSGGSGGSGGTGGTGGTGGFGGSAGDDGGTDASAGSGGVGGSDGGVGGSGGAGGTGGSGGMVYGVLGQSCNGMNGTECQGKSCCENILVPGGTFPMGRSTSGSDAYPSGSSSEIPEHNATVASFALDTYEVTVGRFRKFVQTYNGTPPPDGAAENPMKAGTGWQSGWNTNLPASQTALVAALKCDSSYQTWTDAAGANEKYAINCVNWYEALAFCAWDGGRLPTEAEWEYASAGGDANRLYPWGSEDPSVNTALANSSYSENSPFINVGAHPLGAGRWGHEDLAGGMWEWAFDWFDSSWYGGAGNACSNCANLTNASDRVLRGGSWGNASAYLRAAYRVNSYPTFRNLFYGFRCARHG